MWRLGIAVMACAVAFLQGHGALAASLYQEQSYQSLSSDRKAHHAGDLITVLVYENTSATSAANTSTGRDANVAVELESPSRTRNAGITTNNQLDGRGRTQREGRVLAQITATVKEIAENGDLIIAGEHLLEVNNERQQIKVEGRVRRQDVSDTNTVLSTRLADAKISYVGDGDLSDRQRPAWWHKLLTWFGL
jgi:flagellar L-ring protein FlgH